MKCHKIVIICVLIYVIYKYENYKYLTQDNESQQNILWSYDSILSSNHARIDGLEIPSSSEIQVHLLVIIDNFLLMKNPP